MILLSLTLFFALASSRYTPAIVVNHDKLAHFLVFLLLTGSLHRAFPKQSLFPLMSILTILALAIEFAQYYWVGRELSMVDFSASVAGVLLYSSVRMVVVKVKDVRG